jgi:localization factor PodJL
MHDRSSKSANDAASKRSANSTLEMLDDALSRLEQRMGIAAGGSGDHPGNEDISAIRERQEALARRSPAAVPAAIHDEIVRLREELNREMTSTIAQQFGEIREDLKQLMVQEGGLAPADLTDGFDRLTRELGVVASRVENSDAATLRAEIEELKSLIGVLAQEETLRDMAERWSVIEREVGALPQSLGSREDLLTIASRVSEIQEALHSLPNAGAVDAMEGQIRALAEAVEALAEQNAALSPDHIDTIDRRLDEIGRAIAAIPASAASVEFDTAPLERIEARLSALANRFEESTSALKTGGMEQSLVEISGRLAAMHDSMSSSAESGDAVSADLLDSLNGRFEEIARRLDSQHASFEETGTRLFQSIDARMEELARRIDENGSDAAPVPTFDHLERRIEEIAQMLSSGDAFSPDVPALEGIENQIAALSDKISSFPAVDSTALADLTPRLAAITDQLASGREGMIAAARDAAEEILSRFSSGVSDDDRGVLVQLAGDLRGLEEMARSADDRNSRTFEAIHDTLIKVADRIAGLEASLSESEMPAVPASATVPAAETRNPAPAQEAAEPVRHIEDAPPVDYASGEDRAGDSQPASPAEAAAHAARAAIGEDSGEPASDELASGMDALAGMVAARRAAAPIADTPPPVRESEPAPEIDVAGEEHFEDVEEEAPAVFGKAKKQHSDPDLGDEPLEPGSGGPDLAAIMKRVREERDGTVAPQGESAEADDDDAGKSDFIAAARRAARAAAAEVSVYETAGDGEDGKKKSKGHGGFLASRRRPLMLGAGAILLALLAVPLVRGYLPLGDAPDDVAVVEEPAASAVEEVAPEPQEAVRVVEAAPEQDPAGDEPVQVAEAESEPVEPKVIEAPSAEVAAPAETAAVEDDAAAEAAGVDDTIRTSGFAALTLDDIPSEVGPVALREAAVEGDPKALFVIGDMLMGDGPSAPGSDMQAAVNWFEMAAEMGFAPAQYRTGNAYEKGFGVERDLKAAMTWYQLAAEQGNVSAMHNLAVLYATEVDGHRDMPEAARWFLEAAERGVKDSQVNLAILAARGEGVPQDLAESYKWLALAAKSGDKDAAAKRDEVAKFLSPEQLELARGAVELWKPRQPDPTANGVEMPEAWKVGKETTASIPPRQQKPTVDMKKAIRNIQAILNNAGFDAGVPDGIMGDQTRRAISEFQQAHDMVPTGEIDRALVDKLLEVNEQS